MRFKTETSRVDLIAMLKAKSLTLAPPGEPFTLASGQKSTYFIDVKKTVLDATGLAMTCHLLYEAIPFIASSGVDAVAGVTLGGCPLATGVSFLSLPYETPLNAIYVRKEAKDHGTKNLVEGIVTPGMRVVLLEDVATTGGSSLSAVKVLRDAGIVVAGVIAVVDRLQGAEKAFQAAGIPFYTLIEVSELLPQSN